MGEFFMDDSYLEGRVCSRHNLITAEMLEAKGFEHDLTVEEYLVSEDIHKYCYLEKNIGNKYFIHMQLGVSNMNGRDWSLHVDNSSHSTIGCVDISTVEHFNTFMQLLEIDFRL